MVDAQVLGLYGMENGGLLDFASTTTAGSGTITNSSSSPKTGARCLVFSGSGGGNTAYATIKGDTGNGLFTTNFGLTSIFMSFSFRADTTAGWHDIVSFKDSSGNVVLKLATVGSGSDYLTYQLQGSTNSSGVNLDNHSYYNFGILCNKNATSYFYIETAGAADNYGFAVYSCTASNFNIDRIELGILTSPSAATTTRFDNIIVTDLPISLGCVIDSLSPESDVTNTMSSGTYADVDEVPDDGDTTYAASASATKTLEVNVSSARSAGFTLDHDVLAVKAHFVVRALAYPHQDNCRIVYGAFNSSITFVPGTSYEDRCILLTDSVATGNKWKRGEIDDIKLYYSNDFGTQEGRVTQMIAEVAYNPFSPKVKTMMGASF